MRDPKRIDRILKELKELWEKVPDWRLGQLIENVKEASGAKIDTFYVEDDHIEKGLERIKNRS